MELFDVAIGLGIGLVIGSSILYIASKVASKKRPIEKAETDIPKPLPLPDQEKLVQMPELEKARKELNAILLEKELLSSALTRVYEAEVQKKITKEEREQLSKKYREQLKRVEEKLGNTELLIEVGELENLRDELIDLFERKIGQIESRLNRAKAKLVEVLGPAPKPTMPTKVVPKKEKPKVKPEGAKVDDKVKALREEVLQALDRLEQIDIEE
ncbi:MAG: hypothetical protein H3Z50_01455 [archaeon]|nr:hypothetical protein [archaeon]MCP8307049.1 hypothetical protein [archaeon]